MAAARTAKQCMRGASNIGERGLAVIATVLSAVAGYIDALGWLLFSHVYVANMSGNSIALGRNLVEDRLAAAAARVWPIVTFALGLFVSELLYELAKRRGRPSSMSWTLSLDAAAIGLLLVLPWPATQQQFGMSYFVPTGLLALAMGLQNASLVRIGASSVYTTHVTGNLTRLAREAAHVLLPDAARERRRSRRRVLLMAALWSAYTIGSALGALAVARFHRYGALAAVVVLVALVVFDRLKPIGGHEPPAEANPIF